MWDEFAEISIFGFYWMWPCKQDVMFTYYKAHVKDIVKQSF